MESKNPKRKHVEQDFEDEDDDMEVEDGIDLTQTYKPPNEDQMDMDEMEQELIEFEFYDPNPNQFHSTKNLLNGFLDGLSFGSSELAEIVTNQVVVGTMIGCEDDEQQTSKNIDKNIFAFSTILNLHQYEKNKVVQEIVNFVLTKSEKHNDLHIEFQKVLQSQQNKIGLFVNERISNLPPKLVPVLQNQLVEDLKWIKSSDDEDAPYFQLEYILCITKIFQDMNQKQTKKKKGQIDFDNYVYQKFEDNLYAKNSNYVFVFPAQTSKSVAGITNLDKEESQIQCFRMIYLIKMDRFMNEAGKLELFVE